jgi:hypothetical protein
MEYTLITYTTSCISSLTTKVGVLLIPVGSGVVDEVHAALVEQSQWRPMHVFAFYLVIRFVVSSRNANVL